MTQPRQCTLRAPREVPDEEELGMVGHAVAAARGPGPIPRQASDVHREPVLVGSIVLHGGPGFGPRPVEKERKPVVEQVEEADERWVVVVPQAERESG